MNNAPHEVAIIDDDQTLCGGLAALLHSIGVSATTYGSAEDFLADAPASAACVVTDMRMPGMSGLELQEELAQRRLHVPLIVLTGYADVAAAVRSMKAGAFDFIQKPCSPQLLLETVGKALRQGDAIRRQQDQARDLQRRYASLTPREKDVMRCVVRGMPNKLIATELGVAEKTVEFHRGKVMQKMQAQSIAELVRMSLACPQERSAAPFQHLPAGTLYLELGETPGQT